MEKSKIISVVKTTNCKTEFVLYRVNYESGKSLFYTSNTAKLPNKVVDVLLNWENVTTYGIDEKNEFFAIPELIERAKLYM